MGFLALFSRWLFPCFASFLFLLGISEFKHYKMLKCQRCWCRKDLGIDAGVKADTVFEVGQSIKCRVLRCDSASCRLSLSFVTSSHRFVSSLTVDIECASLHLQTHLLTMIGRCYCIMNCIWQTMQCN
jgi:hypothetical protein